MTQLGQSVGRTPSWREQMGNIIPHGREGISEGFPIVRGTCPACGCKSLFLGSGGYVTCSIAECPDPGAASDRLEAH